MAVPPEPRRAHRVSLAGAWPYRFALLTVLGGASCQAAFSQALPRALAPAAVQGVRQGYPASLTQDQAQALKQLKGYLPADEVPDSFHILPPAPSRDSPTRQADVAAYRETRRLQGGARWSLAASDAIATPSSILADESCALGVRLDQTNAPHLVALLTRVGRDTGRIVDQAKEQFRQLRPFVALGGPICTEDARAATARSYSYPSGHTTYSWAVGLILAELAPDRATPMLARARAYGESRVVCGVHWVSDVDAGRDNGSILVAALHAQPQFQADLAAGRGEVGLELRLGVQRGAGRRRADYRGRVGRVRCGCVGAHALDALSISRRACARAPRAPPRR